MASVDTAGGRVVGTERDGVRVFRGVRYAAPPVGPLRWRPPRKAAPRAVVDATAFGPVPPQNPDPLARLWGHPPAPPGEDCLAVDIWAPAAAGPPRPVVVWVPGGAFLIGGGSAPWYDGSRLAADHGVVVVAVSYRLGALGFLDLSAFGPEYADAGNLGLLDQVAALGWVRDHIAAFGGDPANVTAAGQSAGAISLACLLAAPAAGGLFGRAVLMSGGANFVRPVAHARRVAADFLRRAGAARPADLLDRPVADLLRVQAAMQADAPFGGATLFGPAVGGPLLPDYPADAVAAGAARGVQLLVGSTADEAHLWALYGPALWHARPGCLGRWLAAAAGTAPARLLAAYRAHRPADRVALAVMGDAAFRLPVLRLAEAQAGHRSDTRVYLFDYPSPLCDGGSPHAADVPFVFGTVDHPGAAELTGRAADRHRLSAAVRTAWANFARTGDPDHPGLPPWPAYDLGRRPTMVLGRRCRVEADPHGAERAAWDGVPFDGRRPPADDLPTRREVLASIATRADVLAAVGGLAAAAAAVGWAVW